ncbi:hypothetical protein C5B90_17970 [Haloferax sp. Atlit-12N]|nr:hypothetical protein C5B90_17970 [Haloferax sp. Atlit-12N]
MGYLRHAVWYIGESGAVTIVGLVFSLMLQLRVSFDLWPFILIVVSIINIFILFRRFNLLLGDYIERNSYKFTR